ncbi:MAG: ABC transporter ATP-binding protein [Arcanobacterium sp.]|nr:ABC transporter ATP-binding protein [Arcanobacterium sp.]
MSGARSDNPQAKSDMKLASKQGRAALRELLSPIRIAQNVGHIMAITSAILRVFPFVALVGIGNEFVAATNAGTPVDQAAVTYWVQLLIGTFLGGLFAYFVGLVVTHIADNRLSASIQQRIINCLGRAPLTWFSENTSGHVRKVLQDDVKNLHMLVAHRPVDSLIAVLLPLFCAIYAFVIDWRLGLLTIASIPVYLGAYGLMMRGMDNKSLELDSKLDKVSAAMVEFVKGIQVVKTFGITGKAHRKYAETTADSCDFMEKWNGPMVNAASVTAAIVSTPLIVLLFGLAGGWFVHQGWVSSVEVIAGCLIAIALPSSINVVTQMAWNYQMAGAAAKRVLDVIHVTELSRPEESIAQPRDASVEFSDVWLSYGETKALQGVTLRCEPGSVTALMGPSGAGKTTLAKLAARFMDPDAGNVKIGGVDVRELSLKDLYRHIGFVLQDAQLLRASIHDNIALARPNASQDEIEQAAKQAQIHDEIAALPAGYSTIVGEEIKLSGGQAQRIAIARALLLDAPILILDEAAAMVDPECEAQIQQAINQLTAGRTVIVIDHRPSSIQNVDQIALFDQGRLVACGTHQELQDQELYRRLWAASNVAVAESEER